MKIGAMVMLIISIINFILLLVNGHYIGGKVEVSGDKAIIFQLVLIVFLAYIVLGKQIKKE